MSTTRSFFFVLPLMATALLAPAAFGESHTDADAQKPTVAPKPPRAQAVHPTKRHTHSKHHHARKHRQAKHRHHHHHHVQQQLQFRPLPVQEYYAVQSYRRLRAQPAPRPHCCPYERALDPVVLVPKINPLAPSPCPPDFADRWLANATLAWVGPTRYYPFQPNGFYPSPRFSNIRQLPASAYDSETEVVGGGVEDYGK